MGAGASSSSRGKSITSCKEVVKVVSLPYHHANDHINNMLHALSELRNSKKLCDVTLEVLESKGSNNTCTLEAHKCILAASSEYFKELFSSKPDGSNSSTSASDTRPDLTDSGNKLSFPVTREIMELILNYFYTGELNVSAEVIPEILENAVKFRIPSLRRNCVYAIQNGFLLSHFRTIIELSESLGLSDVRDFSMGQVIKRFDEFVDCACFLEISEKEMKILVDNRNGIVSSSALIPEIQAFNAILKWHDFDSVNRLEATLRLLRCLHYHKIPRTTLSGYILTHDIVIQDKALIASIEDALGSDKRKVLHRLKHIKLSHCSDESEDSEDECLSARSKTDSGIPKPCLIATGGRMFDQFNAQAFQYNEKHHTWKEFTRLPSTLAYHSVAVLNDCLYVAGGDDSSIPGRRSLANLWRYDSFPDDKWHVLSEMQQPRSRFYLAATNGCLYAFGGYSCKVIRNSVEKYDPASKRWDFAPILRTPRHSHAGCVHRHSVYINGGIIGKESSTEMLRFDPDKNHWDVMSPMRCSRNSHSMVSLRDRIYVIGGEDSSMGVAKCTQVAIECYTPQCDQWHSISVKLPGQSDKEFGCAEFGGKIYILGGRKVSLSDHKHDVLEYNPENDKWETISKLPKRICGLSCAVLTMR